MLTSEIIQAANQYMKLRDQKRLGITMGDLRLSNFIKSIENKDDRELTQDELIGFKCVVCVMDACAKAASSPNLQNLANEFIRQLNLSKEEMISISHFSNLYEALYTKANYATFCASSESDRKRLVTCLAENDLLRWINDQQRLFDLWFDPKINIKLKLKWLKAYESCNSNIDNQNEALFYKLTQSEEDYLDSYINFGKFPSGLGQEEFKDFIKLNAATQDALVDLFYSFNFYYQDNDTFNLCIKHSDKIILVANMASDISPSIRTANTLKLLFPQSAKNLIKIRDYGYSGYTINEGYLSTFTAKNKITSIDIKEEKDEAVIFKNILVARIEKYKQEATNRFFYKKLNRQSSQRSETVNMLLDRINDEKLSYNEMKNLVLEQVTTIKKAEAVTPRHFYKLFTRSNLERCLTKALVEDEKRLKKS